MKLGHINTVLPALKKCLLLDHRSLVDYFGHLRQAQPRANAESFFFENPTAVSQLRTSLERTVEVSSYEREETREQTKPDPRVLPPVARRFSNHISVGGSNDPFEPLRITARDYFEENCPRKLLHFFVPCSFELKVLGVDEAEKGNWQSILFKARAELPCYFKSVSTPSGDIYLTGGSEGSSRCM